MNNLIVGARFVIPHCFLQVPGMKNQNTGVNILYGELSVRICDPIQNSAPRIPLVFDFYLPDTCMWFLSDEIN